jgi:hypothetical protein
MPDESNIQSTANAVKGILEAVAVYQDVVQPAAKEVGAALQTVAKTIHILLAPVSGLVWGYDQIKDFVGARVTEKLRNVPEERLRTPEPNIAGPALESLRYTGHKEELRELYASLLATAMDADKMAQAHPAFVEIIRQLSPDEAKIVRRFAYSGAQALIDVRNHQDTPPVGGRWILKYFSMLPYDATCTSPELGPAYMVNLQRLGLVELRENYRLNSQDGVDQYQVLRDYPTIKSLCEEIGKEPGHRAEIWEGAVHLTALGRQFCYACIYDAQG